MKYFNGYEISKHIPKKIFRECTIIGATGYTHTFCIPYVTVRMDFKNGVMEITMFSTEGKSNSQDYLIPENEEGLLRAMKNHCGESFINKYLRQQFVVRKSKKCFMLVS